VEAVSNFKLEDTHTSRSHEVVRELKPAVIAHAQLKAKKQAAPLEKVRKANGYHKTSKANGYHKPATAEEAPPVMAKAVGDDADWNEF